MVLTGNHMKLKLYVDIKSRIKSVYLIHNHLKSMLVIYFSGD